MECLSTKNKTPTSVPAIPMANPISDSCKAGASFVPSPVTATTSDKLLKCFTRSNLSVGEDLAITCTPGKALQYLIVKKKLSFSNTGWNKLIQDGPFTLFINFKYKDINKIVLSHN